MAKEGDPILQTVKSGDRAVINDYFSFGTVVTELL